MRKYFCLIVVLLNFTNCKQGEKADKSAGSESYTGNIHNLKVEIQAIVPNDDVFEVYFYEEEEKTFSPHKFVDQKVVGSKELQKITFALPNDILPERLRLDFGKNSGQEEMVLSGVSLIYKNKKYVFSDQEIADQFKPSKFLLFDPQKRTIKTLQINGKYDPYFYTMKVSNIVNYLLED